MKGNKLGKAGARPYAETGAQACSTCLEGCSAMIHSGVSEREHVICRQSSEVCCEDPFKVKSAVQSQVRLVPSLPHAPQVCVVMTGDDW
eukprot:209601-Pelagomonas_calceolata.AAC.8